MTQCWKIYEAIGDLSQMGRSCALCDVRESILTVMNERPDCHFFYYWSVVESGRFSILTLPMRILSFRISTLISPKPSTTTIHDINIEMALIELFYFSTNMVIENDRLEWENRCCGMERFADGSSSIFESDWEVWSSSYEPRWRIIVDLNERLVAVSPTPTP